MTNEEFNALVELIRAIAHNEIIEARPAHNRLAKTDRAESDIEYARMRLVQQ